LESEKDRRIRQLERTLGRKSLEIEIRKKPWAIAVWWLQYKIRPAGEAQACAAGEARLAPTAGAFAASRSSPERVGRVKPAPSIKSGNWTW
jgi:hypothetical protein